MLRYFYTYDGKEHGPVSERELQALARNGQIDPDCEVWVEGSAKRFLARNVHNLFHNTPNHVKQESIPTPPPPPVITTDSVSSRFTKRKKCNKKHTITASVVIFVLILSWYFGSQYTVDRDKRIITSYYSERYGRTEWSIIKWGRPYSAENCGIYHDEVDKWGDIKPNTTAYPLKLEIDWGGDWVRHDLVALLRDGKLMSIIARDNWEPSGVSIAKKHMFDVAKKFDEKEKAKTRAKYSTLSHTVPRQMPSYGYSSGGTNNRYHNRYDVVHDIAIFIQEDGSLLVSGELIEDCESELGPETIEAYDKYRKAVSASRGDEFWDIDTML